MPTTHTRPAKGATTPLAPRVPALGAVLANQLIVELCRFPGPTPPALILQQAARVADRGGWKGYRGGRQRLAGWAGAYVRWLKPSSEWTFSPVVALDQTWPSWSNGARHVVDVIAPGDLRNLDRRGLAEIAAGILEDTDCEAVRILTVSAPLASRVFSADGPKTGVALVETDLAFGSAVA